MNFLTTKTGIMRKLLGVLVLTALMVAGFTSQAMAAGDDGDATTATGSVAVNATDTNGLLVTSAADNAITSDTSGGAIVLGTHATTDAITHTASGATQIDTLTISGANLLTFAGDIEYLGDEKIDITSSSNLLFQGDVTSSTVASTLTMGTGTTTATVTFDTPNVTANNIIAMDIATSAAGDTITLAVTDTDGNGSSVTFSNAIGGGSAATAIDTITLGATTVTVFSAAVRADTITNSATGTTTFNGNVVGALNFAANGTVALGSGANFTGAIDNTTGSDGAGTLALLGGADVTLTGNIGSTNSLLAITTDITGEAASANTFTGTVQATTFTITGTTNADEVILQDDVTANVVIVDGALLTVTADKKFVGNITTTAGDGILTFATATVDTTLVSGTVGTAAGNALNTLNMATGAGITSTFASTVDALTITVSGTGTMAVTGAVTAATTLDLTGAATVNLAENLTTATLEFSATGTVNMAADKIIVGNVNNAGTVNFAATTTNSILISGTTGAGTGVTAVNLAPASGVTGTLTGAVVATTVTNSGAGTLAYSAAMTGITNLSGGGAVTVGGNHIGVIDNTSGSAGSGSATVAAGINVTGNIGGTNSLASVTFAGASTQTGSVAATTINVAGAGTTVAFTNFDVTGVLNFAAAGTATVTADEKIVGSVTTATTNTGTLTLATATVGTTLVSGNIGTSTGLLLAVNAGSDNAITQTFGGGINATTITLTGAGTTAIWNVNGDINGTTLALVTNGTVNMADGQNITADVTASGTNITSLTFAGTSTVTGLVGVIGGNELASITTGTTGTVTLDGNWAATTTTIQAGGTLKTTAARTVEGIVSSSGTLDLGGTLTTTAGGGTSDIAAAAATIILAPVSSYTSSVVISSTTTDIDATGTVTLVPDASFTSGTLTIVDTNAGGGTADNGTFAVTGNALASYAVTIDGSNDVILTATANSASAIAASLGVTEDAAAAASSASTALGTATSAQDIATQAAYNTAIQAGGATAAQAVEQIQGSPDSLSAAGGATTAATGGQVVAVSSSRLASLRSGPQFASSGASGFSAGEGELSKALWMKPFVNFGDQDTKTGIAGFESETYGIAFGADVKVGDMKQYVIGISGSYANSDIDGKGAGRSKTDIDSYQVTLYGDYTSDKYYIEAMFGYAFNETETSRTITAGALTPVGKYDSNQYVFSIGAGMPMQVAPNHFLTPNASFMFTTVSADTYTETGAGALNLTINQDDTNIALARFGLRYHTHSQTNSGTLTPELRANVLYDMAGDEGQSTNTFTGGGAAFKVTGQEVAEFGYSFGGGLGYAPLANQGLTISANYDVDFKEAYTGHSANFSLRYEF